MSIDFHFNENFEHDGDFTPTLENMHTLYDIYATLYRRTYSCARSLLNDCQRIQYLQAKYLYYPTDEINIDRLQLQKDYFNAELPTFDELLEEYPNLSELDDYLASELRKIETDTNIMADLSDNIYEFKDKVERHAEEISNSSNYSTHFKQYIIDNNEIYQPQLINNVNYL